MGVPLNVVTAAGDTNGSPVSQPYTLAPGSNRLLIVTLSSELNSDDSATFGVSFGGVPLTADVTFHTGPTISAFNNFIGIYSLREAEFPVGETHNVQFTYPDGLAIHVGVTICTLADMSQGATEDTNADGSRQTVVSRTIGITPTSSDPTIISVSATQGPSVFTEQLSQTEISDFDTLGFFLDHAHATRYKRPGSDGPTSITSVVDGDGRRHAVAAAAFGEFVAGGGSITGTAAASTGPASASASGAHGVSGTAASSTGPAQAQASGAFGNAVSGTAAASTGAVRIGATGIVVPLGAAAARAPAIRARAWGLTTPPPDYRDIGDAFILEVGVPYSVNSIINGALDLIASNGIASLSDSSSHVGNAIKRNFDVERDSLLREYPWNFAMRRAKLAASSEAPAFRFRRAYELPAGPKPEFCLRVWAVGDDDSRNDTGVWEISGRRLLTDLEAPLPIRYIGRIVNPALWDPLTIKALEARLAWQAAYMASGSAALAEQMARIYQERLDAAKAIDAQEGTPEPFEDGTTWVDSRLTGASW